MKLRSIGHTRPQAPVARAKAARIKSSQPRLKGRAVRKQTSNRSLISREKKFADNYLHTNTQIADLKSKMNQRYDILANKSKKTEQAKAALKNQIETLEQKNQILKASKTQLKSDFAQIQLEAKELKEQIKKLHKEKYEAVKITDALRSETDKEITQLKDQKYELESLLDNLGNETDKLKKSLQDKKQAWQLEENKLQASISDLQEANEILEKKCQETLEANENLTEGYNELVDKNKKLEKEKLRAGVTFAFVQMRLQEMKPQIAACAHISKALSESKNRFLEFIEYIQAFCFRNFGIFSTAVAQGVEINNEDKALGKACMNLYNESSELIDELNAFMKNQIQERSIWFNTTLADGLLKNPEFDLSRFLGKCIRDIKTLSKTKSAKDITTSIQGFMTKVDQFMEEHFDPLAIFVSTTSNTFQEPHKLNIDEAKTDIQEKYDDLKECIKNSFNTKKGWSFIKINLKAKAFEEDEDEEISEEQLKKDYGLLGILRDCSDEQLKEAYKRESLAKHPDKNPGNEEAAKIRFQELQNAYERINIARNKANEAEV